MVGVGEDVDKGVWGVLVGLLSKVSCPACDRLVHCTALSRSLRFA